MATKTGSLLSKTARDEARLLEKVDGSVLLSVVVHVALKKSPQFKLPFLQHGAFLKNILEDKDSKDRLQQIMCLFAEDYSQLFLEGKHGKRKSSSKFQDAGQIHLSCHSCPSKQLTLL